MAPPIESSGDLSLSEFRQVVATLVAQVGRLQEELARQSELIAELRLTVAMRDAKILEQAEEIARLKGLPPRPKFKSRPSGMEQAAWPGGKKGGGKAGRGAKRDKLAVTAEVKLKAGGVPAGSRFKGYERLVQDLRIEVDVVLYRRERWETPGGIRIVAPMPAGMMGGFGPGASSLFSRQPRPGSGHVRTADGDVERHGAGDLEAAGRSLPQPGSRGPQERRSRLFSRSGSRDGALNNG